MLLFACHAWITASFVFSCQRPYCLCLSPPPDQPWGSVVDGAPSSNPLSLVCAPGFSSPPAHSCLFSATLPFLHGFVCLLISPAHYPPLFAPQEQGVCFLLRAACYVIFRKKKQPFAVAVTLPSCWALPDFNFHNNRMIFYEDWVRVALFCFPLLPPHVLILCPLTPHPSVLDP